MKGVEKDNKKWDLGWLLPLLFPGTPPHRANRFLSRASFHVFTNACCSSSSVVNPSTPNTCILGLRGGSRRTYVRPICLPSKATNLQRNLSNKHLWLQKLIDKTHKSTMTLHCHEKNLIWEKHQIKLLRLKTQNDIHTKKKM
jgi:hypothetical protein